MRPKYLLLLVIVTHLLGLSSLAFRPVLAQGVHGGYGGWMHGGYGMPGGQWPPALQFLRDIPRDERFDHFRGAQMTVADADGVERVLHMTPGTVQSISAQSISIVPNGQTAARSFNVTSDTVVAATPQPGSVQALVNGDKVVVLTLDDSEDAVVIHKFSMMSWGMDDSNSNGNS